MKSLSHGILASILGSLLMGAHAFAGSFPDPAVDAPKASTPAKATAVFAGGCFWGVDAVWWNYASGEPPTNPRFFTVGASIA